MYLRTRKSPLVLELVRIVTPDMDRIRLGGRLSSPSVLIIFCSPGPTFLHAISLFIYC